MAKLELKDILGAIDLNAKTLWDELDEEQKKSITFFTLNRFISSVNLDRTRLSNSKKREIQEHFVLSVNEYFNKHFFSLSKHPKLQWLLLCACAHETKNVYFHEYIKLEKEKNPKQKILEILYPKMKLSDIEALSQINSLKEVMQLAKDHGWDDKKVKEYL